MSLKSWREEETEFSGKWKREGEEEEEDEEKEEEEAVFTVGVSSESEQLLPDATTRRGRSGKKGHGSRYWRNMLAFWIFGLCNNFPYVIMLSAAFDILSDLEDKRSKRDVYSLMDEMDNLTNGSDTPGSCSAVFNSTTNTSEYKARYCNAESTSVILLADILPTFIIKLTLPYVMNFFPYWLRIITSVLFSALSFIMVGLSLSEELVIFGVVCASISSGFGEITFLSFSAHYDHSTVSGWSSGTGAAGIGASLIYAGLRVFLSAKITILLQIVMPLLTLFAFYCLLGKPEKVLPVPSASGSTQLLTGSTRLFGQRWKDRLKLINKDEAKFYLEHIKYLPRLFKYMVPLFCVYISEYMINQGLFELLYYPHTSLGTLCLNQKDQYRWYQVMYQLGVFISRSSVFLFKIKWYWILAFLQLVNFALFFLEAVFQFVPFFWITLTLVLYEGLLGGGVYANAFYTISKQVPKVHREFSMGVASVADTSGIVCAAIAAVFIHNYICAQFVE